MIVPAPSGATAGAGQVISGHGGGMPSAWFMAGMAAGAVAVLLAAAAVVVTRKLLARRHERQEEPSPWHARPDRVAAYQAAATPPPEWAATVPVVAHAAAAFEELAERARRYGQAGPRW